MIIKYVYAVIVRAGDAESAFGPWGKESSANKFAERRCEILGLDWDAEHSCSEGFIFTRDPQPPYVHVVSEEFEHPFDKMLSRALIHIMLDSDELEA